MRAVATLLRAFSYLYHTLLSLFLLGVSTIAWTNSAQLTFPVLPWTGSTLNAVIVGCGVFGLVSTALAFFGKLRLLFVLWSAAVVILLLRGYFASSYRFAPGEATFAVALTAGAFLALLGAWSCLRKPSEKARVYRTR